MFRETLDGEMNDSHMRYFQTLDLDDIGQQLTAWHEQHPQMGALVLLPEAEKAAVASVQSLFQRLRIPLCGAIFPQLIYASEFRQTGVCLLRFDNMPYMALYSDLPRDAVGAMQTAEMMASDLDDFLSDDLPATLFMLLDAMLPNIGTLLDELYLRLANRVHYAGVNAGSESFQPMPCVFDDQRIADNAVLVLLLKPHQGAILEHGYQVQEQSLPATSTDGNRIIQIDWRPAFEVYQELVRSQFGVDINRENFYHYAVHFPFGILRANHSALVRIPVMLDDDNALFCIGEVPPHAMLSLLAAPSVDSNTTLETLQQGLSQLNFGQNQPELLLFYCAGRRLHLGDAAASEELRRFSHLTGAASVAGGLALGEIGGSTLWGYPLFHNATLITARWCNQ